MEVEEEDAPRDDAGVDGKNCEVDEDALEEDDEDEVRTPTAEVLAAFAEDGRNVDEEDGGREFGVWRNKADGITLVESDTNGIST
jgi:hypothetical protein